MFGDLKRTSIIVAIAVGMTALAGAGWGAVVWATGLQTSAQAKVEHEEIRKENARAHREFETKEKAGDREDKLQTQLKTLADGQQQMLEEIRVVRSRTWELLQDKR